MFHINELIIIAGPSGAGKSTIIKNILQNSCASLCTQLGITNAPDWLRTSAQQLASFHDKNIDRLIVHYDLYAQLSQNKFNYLHELIDDSNKVIILTLYAPANILIQRNNLRILRHLPRFMYSLFLFKGIKTSLWKKRKLFKLGYSEVLYEEWFRILKQCKVTNHWLLDSGKSDILNAQSYEENLVKVGS